MSSNSTYIVIPCKDEEDRIAQVIEKVIANNYRQLVIVDDGSSDRTYDILKGFKEVTVVQHPINLGAGAATRTGIEMALELGAEIIVTIDGDTQHNPENIDLLVKEIIRGNDLVIGSRFLKRENNIPFSRRVYNRIANWISFLVTGVHVTDSQSGFRCMTREFAQANPIVWNGFEYCIGMLTMAKAQKLKICEVPIDVLYTPETLKKGQGFWTGLKTLASILSKSFHR